MKRLSLLFISVLIGHIGLSQFPAGKIEVDQLYSASLENPGGENPTRRVTVYLPPGYHSSTEMYPVIYFLHGFGGNDSLQFANNHLDKLLDKAIGKRIIKPVIVVIPDQYTLFKGSWYTNSSLTGNWSDFTSKDLVNYIDHHYRTIPDRESRGITGHSMGGYGAIKIGMLFPDVFSSVYALSPGILGLTNEFGPTGIGYKRTQQIKTREELISGWNEMEANVVVAMGRAFSPNQNNPPFYADLPFTYEGDSLIINYEILEQWNKNSPIGMADTYISNLRKLKALKLDWGRNEVFQVLPITCKMFSQKLENLGIDHYAEEYIGDHSNKIYTDDGRVLNDMLPFFNTYLEFE